MLNPDNYTAGVITKAEKIAILNTLCDSPVGPVVEIGTHLAGTSRMIARALDDLGRQVRFYGIDIAKPQRHRKGHMFVAKEEFKKQVEYKGVCEPTFIEGISHEVVAKLPRQLSWVFVDACHCFDCVKREIMAYAPRVSRGAYIMFHDCHSIYLDYVEPQEYDPGPPRLFGVWEAVSTSSILARDFVKIEQTEPKKLPGNRWLGGMTIFQRK